MPSAETETSRLGSSSGRSGGKRGSSVAAATAMRATVSASEPRGAEGADAAPQLARDVQGDERAARLGERPAGGQRRGRREPEVGEHRPAGDAEEGGALASAESGGHGRGAARR